jgi:hypothetical protein
MRFTRIFGASLLLPLVLWKADATGVTSATTDDVDRHLDPSAVADYLRANGLQN